MNPKARYHGGMDESGGRPEPALREAEAIPPRYWWLKRIVVGSAAALVLLAALRLWWGWYANRLLQAEIDRIVAAGEPIYPEDFDTQHDVPDDQNAALMFQQLESRLALTPDQEALVADITRNIAGIEAYFDKLNPVFEAHGDILKKMREMRLEDGLKWKVRIRNPALNFDLPSLSAIRRVAKLQAASVHRDARRGAHAQAVQTLRDMVYQADAVSLNPWLLCRLVGMSIEAIAAQKVELLAPVLTLKGGGDLSVPGSPREEVNALIHHLLDPVPSSRSLATSMLSERMFMYDILRAMLEGQIKPASFTWGGLAGPTPLVQRIAQWPILPRHVLNARWVVATASRYCQGAAEPSYPGFNAVLPNREDGEADQRSELDRFLTPIGSETFPSLDRAILLHFRALALRRMAALALAIRLYELDQGQRPDSLAALVPEYLAGLPHDPFAADGEGFRYFPDRNVPILYSVGMDGVDNGGEWELNESGNVNMDRLDLPYFLNGDRPRSPAEDGEFDPQSTETVDDKGDIEDDGGDEQENEAENSQPEEREAEANP